MKKSLMFKNALKQVRHGFNRPFMVMFETTLHCNMKCGYCAIWQNQQPEDRAMRDRVFARMDEAADFGVFAWSFSGGEPLMNPNVPDYIEYAAKKGFFTSMPTNGLALKKCAESCAKLDHLEVSIDTLDREKFAKRRGIDGLPTILAALDHLLGTYKRNTIQINAAVDLENLEDLPALAKFCQERGLLLHTEAVHNVVRTTWKTEDVELEAAALDRVAAYLTNLRNEYKCVRFYRDYYEFYRNDGFTHKFPCRSASHLVNMRPDGSVQFPLRVRERPSRPAGNAAGRDLRVAGSAETDRRITRDVGLLQGLQDRLPVRSVRVQEQSAARDQIGGRFPPAQLTSVPR